LSVSGRRSARSVRATGSSGTSGHHEQPSPGGDRWCPRGQMITVAGEALIDLVVDHDGSVGAQPGGGPFNTARTIGRLGLAPVFLGRLSRDGFGRLLHASLDHDGVTLSVPDLVEAPTTLAVVEVDADGAAHYGFYLAGTASCDLEFGQLEAALPDHVT